MTATQKLRRKMRSIAEGAGLTEIVSYALTTPEKATEFTLQPSNLTELMWPMSVERSVLRQNVISGMLDTVAYNVARKNSNVAIYEIGKFLNKKVIQKKNCQTKSTHLPLRFLDWLLKKISKQKQRQLISSMRKVSLKLSLPNLI